MTITTLDVSSFPTNAVYDDGEGVVVDMTELMERLKPSIESMVGTVVKETESFGFAMGVPMWDDYNLDDKWDNPQEFVWFVYGWGPERDRYIANAIRKMRPLLRTFANDSTLSLRFYGDSSLFRDIVESEVSGIFPWGDFPWGGAVIMQYDELTLTGSVSCYKEIEDDIVTRLILGLFGKEIMVASGLPKD